MEKDKPIAERVKGYSLTSIIISCILLVPELKILLSILQCGDDIGCQQGPGWMFIWLGIVPYIVDLVFAIIALISKKKLSKTISSDIEVRKIVNIAGILFLILTLIPFLILLF